MHRPLTKALLAVTLLAAVGCVYWGATSGPSAAASSIQRGGVLKIGLVAGADQLDPALGLNSQADNLIAHEIMEKLVDAGPGFRLQPVLATTWSSVNGKIWKFTLRAGVKFSNGKPFTAADVVYTMARLRSKALGSPDAVVFANVKDVKAVDPTHVTFTLRSVDASFPALLTDYRARMLCKSVKNPAKQVVGTGPFMLKSYAAEDRAVLVKNPNYWGKAANGDKLPYLNEIDFIFSPDVSGQLEGLKGGSLNFVGGLTADQKQSLAGNPGLKVITSVGNYSYELQIRCDQGPAKDVRVRQALLAGTDRQGLINLVDPGQATPGNGTFIGPAYAQYYLKDPGTYNPAKAKQLLAAAGATGMSIKLVTQANEFIPALATAWQAQMQQIGVKVQIQQVPPGAFYTDSGQDTWYQAAFCIVDWANRAVPVQYFQQALTSTAPWNYSRWNNAQFDALVKQIPLELNTAKRASLYKQAQQILRQEVPMINLLELNQVAGLSSKLGGTTLGLDWTQTSFGSTYFMK